MSRSVKLAGSGGSLSDRFAKIEKRQVRETQVTHTVVRHANPAFNQRSASTGRSFDPSRTSNRGVSKPSRGRSGGSDRSQQLNRSPVSNKNGRGGKSNGRGKGKSSKPSKPPSKEQLDKELNSYMMKDTKHAAEVLDSELDAYMASREAPAETL